MSFTIDQAQIIALFLEAVFFGIYLVSLVPTLKALLWLDGFVPFRSIRRTMLTFCLLLAFFACLDVALQLLHVIQAFVLSPDGAIVELSKISDWVNVMKTVDFFIPTLIADLVLVYRCWIVYCKRVIIILLPLLLWIAAVVCSGIVIGIEATLHTHSLINASKLTPFIISVGVITLVQNILTTFLIVRRIWIVDRSALSLEKRGSRRTPLQRGIRIIIESGLIYTTTSLISFVTYLVGSNASYVVTDAEVQIIGIAFNLIIIRSHDQSSMEYTLPCDTALTTIPDISTTGSQHHDPEEV